VVDHLKRSNGNGAVETITKATEAWGLQDDALESAERHGTA